MARSVSPKEKQKEPGGLVQTDKTAELYKKLKKEVPHFEKQIANGNFSSILNFLKTNI